MTGSRRAALSVGLRFATRHLLLGSEPIAMRISVATSLRPPVSARQAPSAWLSPVSKSLPIMLSMLKKTLMIFAT